MPIGIRHGSLLQYSTTVYTIDLKTYYSKMLLKAREKKKKQFQLPVALNLGPSDKKSSDLPVEP